MRVTSSRSACLVAHLLFSASLLFGTHSVNATKHSFATFADHRDLIGPVGTPFGYLANGHYEMQVSDFSLQGTHAGDSEAGFVLKPFPNEAAFYQYIEEIEESQSCIFETVVGDDDDEFIHPDEGPVVPMSDGSILTTFRGNKKPSEHIDYMIKEGEEGLYFLIYQVCPMGKGVVSSFELDFHFCNQLGGKQTFLTAGEMMLPYVFSFFTVSYLVCWLIWVANLRSIQAGDGGIFQPHEGGQSPTIHAIHHVMSILLLVKLLSVLFEAVRYHFIGIKGHAEFWTFLYYGATFVKGSFLFTVILLIGTGWSFTKPFLADRERKIIFLVLLLQVVNNVALTVISNETEGEKSFEGWMTTFHIVDILCCCAVLIPIVWQVNHLEQQLGLEDREFAEQDEEEVEMGLEDDDQQRILSKLKLFRSFYILVAVYVYSTRIFVYIFASMLDYRHLWLQDFAVELVTLAFYVVVGTMFRPVAESGYITAPSEEEEGIMLNDRPVPKVNGAKVAKD